MRDLFRVYMRKIKPEYGQIYWDDEKGPFRLYDPKTMYSLGPVALYLNEEWEAFQAGYEAKKDKEYL